MIYLSLWFASSLIISLALGYALWKMGGQHGSNNEVRILGPDDDSGLLIIVSCQVGTGTPTEVV